MLKYRLLTAAIGLPIFVVAVWFLPPLWFALVTIPMVTVAALEWSQLLMMQRFSSRCFYAAIVTAAVGLSFVIPIVYWLMAAVIVWAWALLALLTFHLRGNCLGFSHRIVKAVLGPLLLVAFWLAMNVLRDTLWGPKLLIVAFALIWALDIAAYFVGRRFGRHHLIPTVSPNKTWEGLLAGMVATMVVALVCAVIKGLSLSESWAFAALALVVGIFSVVGDLFESLLKRQAGLKDSGSIFPGHGGMLDRFDSAIAALPVFALGLLFL